MTFKKLRNVGFNDEEALAVIEALREADHASDDAYGKCDLLHMLVRRIEKAEAGAA